MIYISHWFAFIPHVSEYTLNTCSINVCILYKIISEFTLRQPETSRIRSILFIQNVKRLSLKVSHRKHQHSFKIQHPLKSNYQRNRKNVLVPLGVEVFKNVDFQRRYDVFSETPGTDNCVTLCTSIMQYHKPNN